MSSRPWHTRLLPLWLAGRLPSAWRASAAGGDGGAMGEVPEAVTAVLLGESCSVVRVERDAASGGLHLAQAGSGRAQDLRQLKAAGWFERSQALLVLSSEQRHFLPLDRPDIPLDELGLAARYPLAEALDLDPESLLCTAVPMLPTNDTLRPQMLGLAAPLEAVRQQLAVLRAAGIDVRHIDTTDSALRGMTLLRGRADEGTVALAFVGNDICIGLIWHHQFCALRSLALPARTPGEDAYFEEQLALQIQRTTDHFERHATRLAVRSVLACMPSLGLEASASVLSALPLSTYSFELASAMDVAAEAGRACQGHNDLHALACVAAARLLQPLAHQAAEAAAQLTAFNPMASSPQQPLTFDLGAAAAPTLEPGSRFTPALDAPSPFGESRPFAIQTQAEAHHLARAPTTQNERTQAGFDTPAHDERYEPLASEPADPFALRTTPPLRTASPAALSRNAIEQAAQRSGWGSSFAGSRSGMRQGLGQDLSPEAQQHPHSNSQSHPQSQSQSQSPASAVRGPTRSGSLNTGMGSGGGYHSGGGLDFDSSGSGSGSSFQVGQTSARHDHTSPGKRQPPLLGLDQEWSPTLPASEDLEAELAEWLDAHEPHESGLPP